MHEVDDLLSRLNLNYIGLEKAKKYVDEGRKDKALEEIISHFRNREKPIYMFNESDIAKFQDIEVINEADDVCDHKILGFELGKEINWRFNASADTTKDPEWMWSLARQTFWTSLARAYAITKDEKYAREFIAQLKGFIKSWPVEDYLNKIGKYGEKTDMVYPADAWRTIEAAIRIYAVWIPLLVYFRKSPSWDQEGWVMFLNSIFDHAEFLNAHYSSHSKCSNWDTMESTALFQAGVMFPEFSNAINWHRLGYRRVTHDVRYQFDHEGIHLERTPIYHLTAAGAFLQAYRIAKLNGIPVPPYMLPILEKTAEYIMKLVKPDFTTPMLGDADRNSLLERKADTSVYEGMNNTTDALDINEIRAFFRVLAELTGRKDFLFFSSNREKGCPPDQKCFSMPDAGYFVFHTGWERKDSYFLVTGTSLERGENNAHSHYDAAHLELQVEGEDVLIDTGRFIYNSVNLIDWRNYFCSTAAHNTIEVDKHKMGTHSDILPNVRGVRTFCHKFETSPEIDLVEISHNGYAFMEDPVFHLRRVIYIKPDLWLVDDILTGIGAHEYKLYYNFAPGELQPIQGKPNAYLFTRNKVKMDIIPLLTKGLDAKVLVGSTDPKGGWVSYGYSSKIPTSQLIYSKKGEVPVRFITAISKQGTVSINISSSIDESSVELDIKGKESWKVNLGMQNYEIKKITGN